MHTHSICAVERPTLESQESKLAKTSHNYKKNVFKQSHTEIQYLINISFIFKIYFQNYPGYFLLLFFNFNCRKKLLSLMFLLLFFHFHCGRVIIFHFTNHLKSQISCFPFTGTKIFFVLLVGGSARSSLTYSQRFRKHECQDENGRRIKVGHILKIKILLLDILLTIT